MPKVVDHEARRKFFIDAAYESILEDGLAKTTIRSVAKRAGFTTGALVHYFKDKEELIRQVLEADGSKVRSKMVDAQQTFKGRVALRKVLLEALPKDKKSSARWRIWLALWYHSEGHPEMRKEERRRYKEWIGRISEMLNESIELGELPDKFDVAGEAKALVALADGLGVQYLMANGRLSGKQITQIIDSNLARLYS